MLSSVSFWPLLIIELVARVVPARSIIRKMERQMRDKLSFLHHSLNPLICVVLYVVLSKSVILPKAIHGVELEFGPKVSQL